MAVCISDLEGIFIPEDFTQKIFQQIFQQVMKEKGIENSEKLYQILSKTEEAWKHKGPVWGKYYDFEKHKLFFVTLKGCGVTNKDFQEASRKVVEKIELPESIEKLKQMYKIEQNLFINTNQWDKFLEPIIQKLEIPIGKVYCNKVDFNDKKGEDENFVKEKIKMLAGKDLPKVESGGKPIIDWDNIKSSEIKWDYQDGTVELVNNVYGNLYFSDYLKYLFNLKKQESDKKIWKQAGLNQENTIGIGYSIIDRPILEYIKQNGGTIVSYLGNNDIVDIADIGIIPGDQDILPTIIEYHKEGGLDKLKELAKTIEKELINHNDENKKNGSRKNKIIPPRIDLYKNAAQNNQSLLVDLTEMGQEEKYELVRLSKRNESIPVI